MEPRLSIPGTAQLALFGLTIRDAIALYGRWYWMSDAEKMWFRLVGPGWEMPEEPDG